MMKKLGIVSVIAALAITCVVACGCTSTASEESAQDNQAKSNQQAALDKETAASNNSIVGEWAFCSLNANNSSTYPYQTDVIIFAEDGSVDDYRFDFIQEKSSYYSNLEIFWKPYVVAHAEIDGKQYSFYVEEVSYIISNETQVYGDTFWAVSDDVMVGFYDTYGEYSLKYFIVSGDFGSRGSLSYLGGRVA